MRLECQVFLFWFSQDLLFCSCCVQKRDGERNSLQNLQNQELLIHKPPGDISVRCPGSVSSGVIAAVTALHYSAALSDYSAVTGFLSRLKWSCLAIKISQPSNSYQPARLLGWDPSPPQIRGQVGGRNTVGLSVYLPSPSDVQIHQDARVSEWILGFSRERAEIAEFIPARPGYISDNAVTLGLSCNFLEDEAQCDRWHSWWKSCRGRGHVALPSNLRRDRSERGHEEGPAATSTFPFLALFAKKPPKKRLRRTSGKPRVKDASLAFVKSHQCLRWAVVSSCSADEMILILPLIKHTDSVESDSKSKSVFLTHCLKTWTVRRLTDVREMNEMKRRL